MIEPTSAPGTVLPRPNWQRLLHACGETILGLLLAAGLFVGTVVVICGSGSQCNSFGGIAFYLFGFIVAVLGLGAFVTLCRRRRFCLRARQYVDIASLVLTIAIWAAVYFSDSQHSIF